MTDTIVFPPSSQVGQLPPRPGEGVLIADFNRLIGPTWGRLELWTVTPEVAATWLALNKHNRNEKPTKIAAYARDIVARDWSWTGEPIRFATLLDGSTVLIDGQNRLTAIIRSGLPVTCLVMWGLAPSAQRDVDTGATRTLADVLTMNGETQPSHLSAILRPITLWNAGQRRTVFSKSESHATNLRTLEAFPEIRELVQPARSVYQRSGLQARIVGLLMFATQRLDLEDSAFFFGRLADGQGLLEGDPIYTLRRTVEASRRSTAGLPDLNLLALSIKAWNFYRRGEQSQVLRWRAGGANPEPFPEPE